MSLRHIKLTLWIVIAVFAVAAISISVATFKRQSALREVSRYNIAWAASQAVNETVRFEQRVAAFGLQTAGVDKDEVQLRFEILINRLNLLRDGSITEFTEHDPAQRAAVNEFESVLAEVGTLIPSISQPETIKRILERLAPLEGKLGRFAAAANNFGAEQVAEDQHQLLELHWIFSALAAGLALCGFALMGLLFWQNRVIGRARDQLHEMTHDLQAAKEVAEAASAAKSRFLATMSHELRTPLNAIVGFSEMIAQEVLGPVRPAKYREYATDILRSGRHMCELVGDVLMMAKLEAGHYEFSLAPTDLRQVVQACVEMFRGAEMAQGRDVALVAGSDWPVLRTDERAVRQMLLNLLSNAVKFSAPDTRVEVLCRRKQNGELWLTVSDHGIGMSAEEVELVVQPFQQADNTLGRKYEGTGLGLSIVKAMIESHGGRLAIDSEPGGGSRISLVFQGEVIETEPFNEVA